LEIRVERLVERPTDDRRRAVAIGNFDGVHLGHAKLLQACVTAGRRLFLSPAALTFDPHPAAVVSPHGAPPRVQTLASRKRRLREIGIEDLVHLSFDRALASLTPAQFVDQVLVDGVGAACVVVGQGFRFGVGRSGDVDTLSHLGQGRFETIEVPTMMDSGERISSSRIREALLRGDLVEVRRYLGRDYEIEGEVVHGDHRGRTLGFPTANIDLNGVSALPRGVYVADAFIEGESVSRRAAVNLGVRPTFGGEVARLEAHLPDFDGDLYGRTVRLIFHVRLREERRFDSVQELKTQLAKDVEAARLWSVSAQSG